MTKSQPPVFLPHNEPYLGHPYVLEFDRAIPPAMRVNIRIAQGTFGRELSPLEQASVQLVPQAVSIALSIRELIRQGYLFSAALLLRPLIERVGLVKYLQMHPDAVQSWHSGWPRRDQPSFQVLLELITIIEGGSEDDLGDLSKALHKLIHPDPAGAFWNMISRDDGHPAFASGKMLTEPDFCGFVSVVGARCLKLVIILAEEIFASESNGA